MRRSGPPPIDTSSHNFYTTAATTQSFAYVASAPALIRRVRKAIVEDAPDDLDEVEAAIDAEPRSGWVGIVRLALVAYSVGFWLTIAWWVFG